MKILASDGELSNWQDGVEQVRAGETVLIDQDGEPVAALILYEDFLALQDKLEELSDLRAARAVIAEYESDPSTAISIEEMIAELDAGDRLEEDDPLQNSRRRDE